MALTRLIQMPFCAFIPFALICLCVLPTKVSQAQLARFTIDPDESWIRIVPTTFADGAIVDGSYIANTYGIENQVAGSLDSTLSGTLTGNISGSTLTFSGNNIIDVPLHPSKPFQPPEIGEDNFGANLRTAEDQVGVAAVRDIMARLNGGSVQIGASPKSLQFSLTAGFLDHQTDAFPSGYFELAPSDIVSNLSMAPVTGSFTDKIRIPFSLEYKYAVIIPIPNSSLVLEGAIVASRVAAGLVGDYNGNNIVDAADYVLWRDRAGTSNALPNDPTGGTIGPSQYQQWRQNFGRTTGAGSGAFATAVPEPATLCLLAVVSLSSIVSRRRAIWSPDR